MQPYITFNGINSLDLGLRLIEAEPFIVPRRTRQRETIPGRIGSIAAQAFDMPDAGYRLRLGASGRNKAEVVNSLHGIAAWALNARVMTVWHSPAHWYTGAVEGDAPFSMLTRRNGELELEFMCSPPCRQKALVDSAVWIPGLDSPIAEQLTDTLCTAHAATQTEAFTLSAGAVGGGVEPALHLQITGSWETLVLGGVLTVTESGAGDTLYMDCEAHEVYRMAGGARVNMRYAGAMPRLTGGQMSVSGTNMNISARLLVIERG